MVRSGVQGQAERNSQANSSQLKPQVQVKLTETGYCWEGFSFPTAMRSGVLFEGACLELASGEYLRWLPNMALQQQVLPKVR